MQSAGRTKVKRMFNVFIILMVVLFGLSKEAMANDSPLRNGTEEIMRGESVSVVSAGALQISVRESSSVDLSSRLDGEMVAFMDNLNGLIHNPDPLEHSLPVPLISESGTLYAQVTDPRPPATPDLPSAFDTGFSNRDNFTNMRSVRFTGSRGNSEVLIDIGYFYPLGGNDSRVIMRDPERSPTSLPAYNLLF